jgi:hypothetical protein
MAGFGISTVKLCILHDVPGFQVSTAVFDSRGNSESDMTYIYVGLICSCPRITDIYNKLNKAETKEVHCAFIEAMCDFRLLPWCQ